MRGLVDEVLSVGIEMILQEKPSNLIFYLQGKAKGHPCNQSIHIVIP